MKKTRLAAAALAIVLMLTVQSTVAYFTAQTRTENVITSGNVRIALQQQTENTMGVLPGKRVSQAVSVENTGGAAAYIRVLVEKQVQGKSEALNADKVRLELNEQDWTYEDGCYYYKEAVAPGGVTTPLYTAVSFDSSMGNEYQNAAATVSVLAFAVQTAHNGDSPLNAAGWPEP